MAIPVWGHPSISAAARAHGVSGVNSHQELVVPAPVRETGSAAHREESVLLTSAIRRLACGSRVDWATGRWETLTSRLERQKAGAA